MNGHVMDETRLHECALVRTQAGMLAQLPKCPGHHPSHLGQDSFHTHEHPSPSQNRT